MSLYLVRQRVCAWFGHRWRPSGVGRVGPLDEVSESCHRCGRVQMTLNPRPDLPNPMSYQMRPGGPGDET